MPAVFVSTTFAPDGSKVSEVVESCLEAGIDHLELGSNHCHEKNLSSVASFRKGIFLVHNYFPIPEDSFVLNIASKDKAIRQRSLRQAFDALEFCHAIGAELYTFHPGFLSDPDGPGASAGNYDFQWNDDLLEENALFRDAAFEWMLSGVEQVARRGADLGVKVAIETEGSFRRPHHLLMQRPEEYERFFQEFAANDVGINLNVGHLPLAAKAFGFSIAEFVDLVASRIVAMELSHNDKIDDQHLPLQSDGWYLELLDDPRLQNAYPILEFRNASISDILANIKMIQEKTYVV